MMGTQALAFSLNVINGQTGNPITVGFRWLVEQDDTHHVTPNEPATNWVTKFHKSYMPVVATGNEQVTDITVPETSVPTHYYVSVLPDSGYSMGGAQVPPGLAPFWRCCHSGGGADILVPMAIPSFGGMVLGRMTMLVVPTVYCWMHEIKFKRRIPDAQS